MRFEVSAVVSLKFHVVWDVMPCQLIILKDFNAFVVRGNKSCDHNGEGILNLLGCDAVSIGRPIRGDFVSHLTTMLIAKIL